VYGAGPDLDSVREESERRRLALTFNGAKDHADRSLQVGAAAGEGGSGAAARRAR
jgi:hypothetical protein